MPLGRVGDREEAHKGISTDLHVTGEWAMVVRRFMNKSGVLKVFLIGSRKYAYRLSFRRAKVPDWVFTAMNSIEVKNLSVSRTSAKEPRQGRSRGTPRAP